MVLAPLAGGVLVPLVRLADRSGLAVPLTGHLRLTGAGNDGCGHAGPRGGAP
ncbi:MULTISPECIES: hypothetical protein [unclassified Streptomyces]|uniref:hypothetical protein n=1 Tax=unclassified Streptomyces TaxID=2593676 RepID=UPI001301047D|nr:hypothetical protein [Streptomyces sp. CB00316]